MAPEEPTDTRWSRIEAQDLAYVVRRYWKPIRRFLSDRLGSFEEAEDATQELFVKFLERELLATADRSRGRFRSYLFTVVRRFLIDRLRAAGAASRGGAAADLPLDARTADAVEAGPGPEQAFDREWFYSLLNRARRSVRARLEQDGRSEVYRAFHLYYFGDDSADRWTQPHIARRLGITATQVNNHVHRARELLRREVRAAVCDYVGSEAELEAELADFGRHLGAAEAGALAAVSDVFVGRG